MNKLVEALHRARIMATEAYLDQDGKSIIAASDFKDIEQFLLQALAEYHAEPIAPPTDAEIEAVAEEIALAGECPMKEHDKQTQKLIRKEAKAAITKVIEMRSL